MLVDSIHVIFLTTITIVEMTTALSETLKSSWQINVGSSANVQFGDLLVTPRQMWKYSAFEDLPRSVSRKDIDDIRWVDNIVPFQLSDKYSDMQKALIMEALLELQKRSCFKFIKRTTEDDYISMEPLDGCYSYVGRIGGRQVMSLARDCLVSYIIWHEMMHALGFEHEHQRPDRDAYIHVQYSNVVPGQIVNFEKLRMNEVDLYGHAYDYYSIMHYDGTAFGRFDRKSKKRLVTMIPIKRGVRLIDNTELTMLDIEKLNRLGECTKQSDEQNGAYNCEDIGSNCLVLAKRGFCELNLYQEIMRDMCTSSCGYCPRTMEDISYDETTKSSECTDSDPLCAIYARNGLCTAPLYAEIRKQRCKMTCQLC